MEKGQLIAVFGLFLLYHAYRFRFKYIKKILIGQLMFLKLKCIWANILFTALFPNQLPHETVTPWCINTHTHTQAVCVAHTKISIEAAEALSRLNHRPLTCLSQMSAPSLPAPLFVSPLPSPTDLLPAISTFGPLKTWLFTSLLECFCALHPLPHLTFCAPATPPHTLFATLQIQQERSAVKQPLQS